MPVEPTKEEFWAALLKCDAEIVRLRKTVDLLKVALGFYADPATYAAIGFVPDQPCGDFIQDFSDDHGDEELPGYRPGKLARDALSALVDNVEA